MGDIYAFYAQHYSAIYAYLIGGLVVNAMYDWSVSRLNELTGNSEHLRFTILERIWVGLLWPLPLSLFIFNFIRTIFGNKQD
jgi:hypothetical protein